MMITLAFNRIAYITSLCNTLISQERLFLLLIIKAFSKRVHRVYFMMRVYVLSVMTNEIAKLALTFDACVVDRDKVSVFM